MKLQPNQQAIIDILSDVKLHCLTKELFMKDDRARISALRNLGFIFDSPRCNMGHNHSSGVVMRRLVEAPTSLNLPRSAILSPIHEELVENRHKGQFMPITALKAIFLKERTWK